MHTYIHTYHTYIHDMRRYDMRTHKQEPDEYLGPALNPVSGIIFGGRRALTPDLAIVSVYVYVYVCLCVCVRIYM